LLKLDGNLGGPLGQVLARTQVKGNARPAPVVEEKLDGQESLGKRIRRDALLFTVSGRGLASDGSGRVLAAYDETVNIVGRERYIVGCTPRVKGYSPGRPRSFG
jgi:hypothetical protein